ncbi:uncharacterized protein LOC102901625 [Felis catus]|uniref:uncharacterized protein LOC102901625 n=1 Tax=Felis catus TaxID=9685 RepID=UPI001D19C247|nr:uncharacterized protein LOC102901625 [Felis catus]
MPDCYRELTRKEGQAERPSRRGHPRSRGSPGLSGVALDRLEAGASQWHFRRRSPVAVGGRWAPDEGPLVPGTCECGALRFTSLALTFVRADPAGNLCSHCTSNDQDSPGFGKASSRGSGPLTSRVFREWRGRRNGPASNFDPDGKDQDAFSLIFKWQRQMEFSDLSLKMERNEERKFNSWKVKIRTATQVLTIRIAKTGLIKHLGPYLDQVSQFFEPEQ